MNSQRQILAATAAALTYLAASATPGEAAWATFGHTTATPVNTNAGPAVRKQARRQATTPRAVAKAEPDANLASKVNGPLQVVISIDKQQLTLYSGDQVIARSRVSTGQRGHPTPTGVFSIIQKDRWHRSNIYDDAPMWFMQRITWSGVAMHQGVVPNYPASHGCIRLPAAFAQQMWTTTQLGARVIVAHGQLAPTEISHAKLFAPRRAPAAPVMAQAQAQALQAAERAWTFAQLASKSPLVGATLTDTPDTTLPAPLPPQFITRPLKPGPISVFISRKEGKLFVRKGFEPVFDVPVTIERGNEPIGTHVFTAIAQNDDAMRWTVVTMQAPGSSAKDALDRITIPQGALDQINELVTAGASLVISDQGLGSETGKGTDFVVLTK